MRYSTLEIRPRRLAAFITLGLSCFALAEGTRTWEQSKFDELVKGTPKGVAILSNGGLELAPSLKTLYTTPSTYIWSIAADAAGNVFAASGAPARVYRITPQGQASVIFEAQELQVQALLVDKSGILYAATAPDGKVYRLQQTAGGSAVAAAKPAKTASADATADARSASEAKPKPVATDSSWSATVYFDPATKYIWDLAEDKAGNLYVATGDHGEIFRVTPKGEHSSFFKSDEVHIRCLAFSPQGDLIAGSDGSGLVYRIAPDGKAFVLYSAPKKEITALAVDAAGNIYAAGAGEKRAAAGTSLQMLLQAQPAAATAQPAGAPGTPAGPPTSTPPVLSAFPAPGLGATGGSEIYRIAPDGSPARIWTSREDLVYALTFDQRGTLLAGTGNRGHVFAILGEDNFSDLLRVGATQVTGFAPAPAGGLYLASSNFGKVFVLGPGSETEGSYESDVFDAHIFSRWGRAQFRGTGNVELFTRSGNVDNPDRNWSPWTKVDLLKDAPVGVPAARFVQWKTVLHAGTPAPRVQSVLLNYLPKNVAPDIDEVTVQVGVRYQSLPRSSSSDNSHFDAPAASSRDRDSIGVKWTAHDDNEDQMVYSVYYRGDGQSRWLLLKDALNDKFYSFDASLLPDGGYTVKVVASDAPSHSTEPLSSEKESTRFEVDTTPPLIENLAAVVEGKQLRITFRAVDSFSPIKRAEYSVDAGDWKVVEPAGQISDSRTETYDFRVAIPEIPPAPLVSRTNVVGDNGNGSLREHVVVVRAYDRFDNMNAAKTVIAGK
jgi:sugar lactone lactonase YvrE